MWEYHISGQLLWNPKRCESKCSTRSLYVSYDRRIMLFVTTQLSIRPLGRPRLKRFTFQIQNFRIKKECRLPISTFESYKYEIFTYEGLNMKVLTHEGLHMKLSCIMLQNDTLMACPIIHLLRSGNDELKRLILPTTNRLHMSANAKWKWHGDRVPSICWRESFNKANCVWLRYGYVCRSPSAYNGEV